ncbi:unnamed protein product, partial [Urochloa humidicola]
HSRRRWRRRLRRRRGVGRRLRGGGLRAARIRAPRWCRRRRRGGGCGVEADGAAAGDGAGGGGCVPGQLETLASAALGLPLHRLHPHHRRRCRTRSPRRAASVCLPRSPPPPPQFDDLLAQLGPAVASLFSSADGASRRGQRPGAHRGAHGGIQQDERSLLALQDENVPAPFMTFEAVFPPVILREVCKAFDTVLQPLQLRCI